MKKSIVTAFILATMLSTGRPAMAETPQVPLEPIIPYVPSPPGVGTPSADVPTEENTDKIKYDTDLIQSDVRSIATSTQNIDTSTNNMATTIDNPPTGISLPFAAEDDLTADPMPEADLTDTQVFSASTPASVTATGIAASLDAGLVSLVGPDADSLQRIKDTDEAANAASIATSNLQALEARLALVPELRTAVTSATNLTNLTGVNGLVQVENQVTLSQIAQGVNLLALMQAKQMLQPSEDEVTERKEHMDAATMFLGAAAAGAAAGATAANAP